MKNKIVLFAMSKYTMILQWLNCLSPLMMLIVRIYMSRIFFLSGLQKFHDFDNAVSLFANEYHVPVLSPYLAAAMGMTFELGCSVLLALGLATRLATLPVLGMTTVIYFTYDNSAEVCGWFLFFGMILFYGPSRLSLDHLIKRKFSGKDAV